MDTIVKGSNCWMFHSFDVPFFCVQQRVRRSVTNAGRSDREANVMLWYAIKRAPYWWVPFIEALDSCGYTHLSGILKVNLGNSKTIF